MQMFSLIFSDLKILYKNFIHWNVSKIIIAIMGFLLGILIALPFLFLAFLLAYFSPIDWKSIFASLYLGNSFDIFLLGVLFQNLVYFVPIVFLSIIGIGMFFLGNSYKYILFSNLYLRYLDKEKLNFFKGNIYFSKKHITKYIGILSIVSLYLLIPFLVFLVLFLLLVLIFGGFESVGNMMKHSPINIFSVVLLIFFVLSIALFFYILYRIQFAFFLFLDDKNDVLQKSKYYIKDSIKKTKSIKVFGKYLLVLIFMLLLFFPFFYLEANISGKLAEYKLLYSYKTDQSFVKTMTEDDKYIVSLLEKKYMHYNNDDLKYELTKYNAYLKIWKILFFLFLGNMENMFFVSFYRRVLLNNEVIVQKKEEENNKKIL